MPKKISTKKTENPFKKYGWTDDEIRDFFERLEKNILKAIGVNDES